MAVVAIPIVTVVAIREALDLRIGVASIAITVRVIDTAVTNRL